MIAQLPEVLSFIPQRPPVVMIDKLFSSAKEQTISGLTITADNIFCENGFFTESGLVENIAQTAAAGVGYLCALDNKKVPIGFIAAIKDVIVHKLPAIGDELLTHTFITNTVMDISFLKGVVKCGEALIAECEMRIFVKPE